MPIEGLEIEDKTLSGQISVLSGNEGLGKKLIPSIKVPSIWDLLWASIKKKLGL